MMGNDNPGWGIRPNFWGSSGYRLLGSRDHYQTVARWRMLMAVLRTEHGVGG
jgi:hypothetical protein